AKGGQNFLVFLARVLVVEVCHAVDLGAEDFLEVRSLVMADVPWIPLALPFHVCQEVRTPSVVHVYFVFVTRINDFHGFVSPTHKSTTTLSRKNGCGWTGTGRGCCQWSIPHSH